MGIRAPARDRDTVGAERSPYPRVLRYYPRALTGDGGITSAVRHWSAAASGMGAPIVVAYDRGQRPAGTATLVYEHVMHAGTGALRVPVRLESVLEGADVCVLHSGWALHNARAGAAARRSGVPYVLEPRGAYDPEIFRRRPRLRRAWWSEIERDLVLGARAIHVFFPEQRSHLHRLGYRGEFVVAPNGVASPVEMWDGGSGGYLLWFGRFDPHHKGLDLLVRAVALMPRRRRPRLLLRGPDRRGGADAVRSLVERLGLEPWVDVRGPVVGRQKAALLARAAGFVYPSRWEGFGNAPAEAAVAGVPLLTTPYPLGTYLAERGAAIVAAAEPRALAAGLERLLSEEGSRAGVAAAAVSAREFAWATVARRWLDQVGPLL